MNLFRRSSLRPGPEPDVTAEVDMLRARLEADVARPAVVAIAATTANDGAGVAAHALAQSLAAAGYPTLYIETAHASRGGRPVVGKTFHETSLLMGPQAVAGHLAVMNSSDPTLQKRTSQRDVVAALEGLRTTFDYVVLNAEHGLGTSFESAIVTAADFVIVAVRTGRRQTAADARLAQELERLEDRFLGVIALAPAMAQGHTNVYAGSSIVAMPSRSKAAGLESEFLRGQVAETSR